MPELVAIRLADPVAAADAVVRAWNDGQAVLLLDPSGPVEAAGGVLRQMQPSAVVAERPDGVPRVSRLAGGVEVPDGTAAVVLTSGSTGRPRGIVLSHAAIEASARASVERLGCEPGQRWLGCLPLWHVAGLAVLVRSRLLGSAPEVMRFGVEAVASAEAQWWPLVPTMLHRLLEAGVSLDGRGLLLGGARVSPQLVLAAQAAGASVVVGYGMTETCGGCVYDGVPLDGVQVELSDAERVRVRGPVLADGVRGPDGGVEPLVDGDGWYETSDLGHVEEGRLVVDGRADTVIITGGENVAPEAVERALATHLDVGDVAVVGEPDEEWGQRVVALVVPAPGADPPTVEELREHVGEGLPRHALPREVRIVEHLPRTSLGKLQRSALGI